MCRVVIGFAGAPKGLKRLHSLPTSLAIICSSQKPVAPQIGYQPKISEKLIYSGTIATWLALPAASRAISCPMAAGGYLLHNIVLITRPLRAFPGSAKHRRQSCGSAW